MAAQKLIRSFEDAQKRIVVILAEINAEPDLARGAAVNPIFALEELGYSVSPEARAEIEEHVRFGAEKAARLRELRGEIFRIAGHPFDLQSDEALARVLGEELKLNLPRPAAYAGRTAGQTAKPSLSLPPQVGWGPRTEDILEPLRGAHAVMGPLLEYRKLEASEPRLGSRELYDEVRQGRRRTPIVSLQGSLKSRTR